MAKITESNSLSEYQINSLIEQKIRALPAAKNNDAKLLEIAQRNTSSNRWLQLTGLSALTASWCVKYRSKYADYGLYAATGCGIVGAAMSCWRTHQANKLQEQIRA